jgi:repressor LexA
MSKRHNHPTGLPSLTPKQKELLDFVSSFIEVHGYAPSQKEIAVHFGFSSLGTVQNYLVRLEKQGLLTKSWNARRGIEPAEQAKKEHHINGHENVIALPLVGRVAAGRPIEAIETDDYIEIPPNMIGPKEHKSSFFALRVAGDSMIGDGILDGDFVVVKKQPDASNGQTVVAIINNEATIKRLYKRSGKVELHAANPAYAPIIVEQIADFKIVGVFAGLIRVSR